MDNFKKISERVDMQNISTFLLYGVDNFEIDQRGYEKRLKEESDALYKRLNNLYPDSREKDDFLSDISQALVAYEQVYTEIGMKAGAKLIFQLLLKQDES